MELPAEKQRVKELREIVKFQRNQFVTAITNNSDIGNLDHLVSLELAKYEKVSIQCVHLSTCKINKIYEYKRVKIYKVVEARIS